MISAKISIQVGLNINKDIMFIDGSYPDYFFVRFEHLYDDLKELANRLNVRMDFDSLPIEKSDLRNNSDYRELYDNRTKEAVRKAFEDEIERFGYYF